MIPVAWRLSCQNAQCSGRRWTGPVTLTVSGETKKQAIAAARAKGWKPCSEVLKHERRSMSTWYCPACVLRATSR